MESYLMQTNLNPIIHSGRQLDSFSSRQKLLFEIKSHVPDVRQFILTLNLENRSSRNDIWAILQDILVLNQG